MFTRAVEEGLGGLRSRLEGSIAYGGELAKGVDVVERSYRARCKC